MGQTKEIETSSSQKLIYGEHGSKGKHGIIVFYFGASYLGSNACPDMNGVLNRLNVRLIIIDSVRNSPSAFAKAFDHFGCDKYFFVGYQMGCFRVLSIAHSFPSRISEICL